MAKNCLLLLYVGYGVPIVNPTCLCIVWVLGCRCIVWVLDLTVQAYLRCTTVTTATTQKRTAAVATQAGETPSGIEVYTWQFLMHK